MTWSKTILSSGVVVVADRHSKFTSIFFPFSGSCMDFFFFFETKEAKQGGWRDEDI